jgi:hypothetical protein
VIDDVHAYGWHVAVIEGDWQFLCGTSNDLQDGATSSRTDGPKRLARFRLQEHQ